MVDFSKIAGHFALSNNIVIVKKANLTYTYRVLFIKPDPNLVFSSALARENILAKPEAVITNEHS